MGFEIEGLDGFKDKLDKINKKAKELDGEHSVPLDELFDSSFMRKHTSFASFDELLREGGYKVESQADFDALPDSDLDVHIQQNTSFSSWQDMQEAAAGSWLKKKWDK